MCLALAYWPAVSKKIKKIKITTSWLALIFVILTRCDSLGGLQRQGVVDTCIPLFGHKTSLFGFFGRSQLFMNDKELIDTSRKVVRQLETITFFRKLYILYCLN